jgi:hypothetical protein
MTLWKQRLLARYQAPAGDEGGAGGGGGGGGEADDGDTGDTGDKGDAGGEGEDTPEEKARKEAEALKRANGGQKPTDAEAKLLKENMKKKEDLRKANEELTRARQALAAYDGLNPEEAKRLKAEKKTAEEAQLAAKGEWETLKARMIEEHTNANKTKDTTIQTLSTENASLKSQIEELTVGQSFAQSEFIKEDTVYTPAKARKVFGEHFDVVDGAVVGFDKPRGAAGRTPLVDQYGNNMPFEAAMAKLVEMDPDKDSILKSKVKQGAGSTSKSKTVERQEPKSMDAVSKIGAGLGALLNPPKS